MRENESEPGDRREPPGWQSPASNPWTPPGDDSGYPPPHYADEYRADEYRADEYRADEYRASDNPPPPPREDTIAFGNPPGLDYGSPRGYASPPRSRHAGRVLIYVLVAAVAAGFGAGATVVFNHKVTASSAGVSAHAIPAQHDNAPGARDTGLNTGRVESMVEPGLVDIVATLKYQSETAEGTGMVLSSSGLVLTNNHVINNATSVYATMVDSGKTYPAQVVGYDATDDIALLKLEGASGLPTVTFGNSSQLSVGASVLALGNAQGKGGVTPALGIIEALDRSINASDEGSGTVENLHGMEQTSAQIQQGDSGGALADNAGQVVGMITAANTSSASGTTGFAIPINTALSIVRQIAGNDTSSTVYIGDPGFLGVMVATSNSANPRQQAHDELRYAHATDGISACIQNITQTTVPTFIAPVQSGVLIIDVLCGTPVDGIGMQAGDVITAVNSHAVKLPTSLGAYLARFHPGATVTVSWTDPDGGQHTSAITLGPGPVR